MDSQMGISASNQMNQSYSQLFCDFAECHDHSDIGLSNGPSFAEPVFCLNGCDVERQFSPL